MPLLDHFRPPLSERRHWHGFHNAWATYLCSQINSCLPVGYFAEPNVKFGIEIDVATFEELPTASVVPGWVPPPPTATGDIAVPSDVVEVEIYSRSGGPRLAGAIELVNPANKDRPSNRDALVSKCSSYIQSGVGVVLVDVVTERPGDVHAELLDRLGLKETHDPHALFAAAYRPVERDGSPRMDYWYERLRIGLVLPTLPLWLRGDLCVPVDLQSTYDQTCRELRVNVVAA